MSVRPFRASSLPFRISLLIVVTSLLILTIPVGVTAENDDEDEYAPGCKIIYYCGNPVLDTCGGGHRAF